MSIYHCKLCQLPLNRDGQVTTDNCWFYKCSCQKYEIWASDNRITEYLLFGQYYAYLDTYNVCLIIMRKKIINNMVHYSVIKEFELKELTHELALYYYEKLKTYELFS